jgi:iron(III) transport system permease protein
MWGLRSSRTLVVGIATAAFVVFCALPVLYMAASALPTIDSGVLLDSRQRGLLYNTIVLASCTAVLATVVGVPLGFAMARIPLRFKMALRLALFAPALLPPYVVALSWVYLDSDVIVLLPSSIGNLAPDPYSLGGAILVLTIVFYPLAMLATEVGLRHLEPRLEEAALLAASPARVLCWITGPLIGRHVAAAALVIFVLTISEFSVPGLLRVRVFTTEVFTAFAALYDFSRATALAAPLIVVSVMAAVAAAILAARRVVTRRRAIGGSTPLAFETWSRFALIAVICVAGMSLGIPVAVLSREALRSASVVEVLHGSRHAVMNSLVLAAIGATVVTVIALSLGYARARTYGRLGAAIDAVWVALFAVPSTVVAIGLIGLWNRPGLLGLLYGTDAMLVLGYLARLVPVAALVLSAIIQFVPASQEDAAAMAGAGWLRMMTRIIVPQIRVGLVAAWVIAFILAFGEIGTSILVAPPGESTLPIRVYTLIANAPPGHLAALALLQAAVVLCPLLLLGIVVARRENR